MSGLSVMLKPLRDHAHGPGCGCQQIIDARRRWDPSGTAGTIKAFEKDLLRRFQRLKQLVHTSLVTNNALGGMKQAVGTDAKLLRMLGIGAIVPRATRDAAPLDPGRFVFTTSADKVDGFMAWLREQENEGVLEVMPGTPMNAAARTAWSNVYVETAYQKGLRDAGAKLREAGANVAPRWIEGAFSRPVHADRLGLAFTRTFSDLKGITESMDRRISRILGVGLANGDNPAVIARRINETINKIGVTRARMLARTEVINAHAHATLNAFEEAGIEGVEVEAEWLTAEDACPECVALEAAGPYTIEEARALIPAHPNCRCAWAPKVINGTGIELS